MGAIGGMLGTAGGVNGTGFDAPQGANIKSPVNDEQIGNAYNNTTESMRSQQALLAALQAQNGLGNQSQVYNQLQGVANGTGPNPAQAMLAQSTGTNVANQAALMAGQRGAGANTGLIARQAAMQGGNLQQQAAGQAATLQAQQSLNAINSAGGIANTQASNQIGQTNANTASQLAEQQNLLNAQSAYNNAQAGVQSSINAGNVSLANTNMGAQQNMVGGVLKGAAMAAAMASGGEVSDSSAFQGSGPQSKFGQFLSSQPSSGSLNIEMPQGSSNKPNGIEDSFGDLGKALGADKYANINGAKEMSYSGAESMPAAMDAAPMMVGAHGGKVPAVLSPGEKYLKPREAEAVAKGKVSANSVGEVVPGKPKYKGNNYANDTVPAKLEEGGFVIPNSIMQSKNPERGAADFVRKHLAKRGMKK